MTSDIQVAHCALGGIAGFGESAFRWHNEPNDGTTLRLNARTSKYQFNVL